MLARERTSRARLTLGVGVIGMVGAAGLALTASGTQAAERVREQVQTVTGVTLPPVADPAPAAEPTPAAVPAAPRTHRVVVVKNGERTVYEGEAADEWAAANPLPAPPAPPASPQSAGMPVPPVPPVPVGDGGHVRTIVRDADRQRHRIVVDSRDVDIPEVRSMRCPGDAEQPTVINDQDGRHRRVIICTNRIERGARRAAEAAEHAEQTRRLAMVGAIRGVRGARASIAANPHLGDAERAEVLADLDREIADLERAASRHED